MLKPNEELFEKAFDAEIENLLYVDPMAQRTMSYTEVQKLVIPPRDKTKVITYRIPSNMAVQLFDYKVKTNRIVFGPDLVLLGPNEVFTVLSLSGGRPKRADYKKSLAMLLGPDFMIDLVTVDTSDHARLNLQVSYNWQFDIDVNNYTPEQALKIFSSSDYIGLACRRLASLIRGAIARVPFDAFHKHSATIIHNAVFHPDSEDSYTVPKDDIEPLRFENRLLITGIDIQSVEPADAKTRDALTLSVQLAIEITTKSQEANARQDAEKREQEARGKLERQKLTDSAEAEKKKKDLLQLKADSTRVEATGRAVAEARASSLQKEIEAQAEVTQAENKAQAQLIASRSDLDVEVTQWKEDVEHQRSLYNLEISKKKLLAAIEAKKFTSLITAIGAGTVKSMAQAGPENQTRLLQALGLKSVLFTSGNSPINLFNTTGGLVTGNPAHSQQHQPPQ